MTHSIMPKWALKKAALEGLSSAFEAAYGAKGLNRADWFLRLSITGAWFGLWSWADCIKILVAGGILGRSVVLNGRCP